MKSQRCLAMFLVPFFLLPVKLSAAYEKQADGVLFELKQQKETDARWLKIQVCAEDIIRVLAAPGESFSSRPSIMVAKASWEPVAWSVREENDKVEISTGKIVVRVEPEDGSVAFFDRGVSWDAAKAHI